MKKGNIVKIKKDVQQELGRVREVHENGKCEVEWFLPTTDRILHVTIENIDKLTIVGDGNERKI